MELLHKAADLLNVPIIIHNWHLVLGQDNFELNSICRIQSLSEGLDSVRWYGHGGNWSNVLDVGLICVIFVGTNASASNFEELCRDIGYRVVAGSIQNCLFRTVELVVEIADVEVLLT